MKAVTVFRTKDGVDFNEERKAREHEAEVEAVEKLTRALLPKRLDTTDFANGGGFIQLNEERVAKFIAGFREVIATYYPSWLATFDKGGPKGFIGRYLSDSDNAPAYHLWTLACRIDGTHRLWGQPYFANNPHEGKQVRLD